MRKGSIPTLCGYPEHFRLAAETGIPAAAAQRLSRARSGLNGPQLIIVASFEHHVRAEQERIWNFKRHGFRGLEIDGELELRGLLYGDVFWLPAF